MCEVSGKPVVAKIACTALKEAIARRNGDGRRERVGAAIVRGFDWVKTGVRD
jgi:hypothetical protein